MQTTTVSPFTSTPKISSLPEQVQEEKKDKSASVGQKILCQLCNKEPLEKLWCGRCKKAYYCDAICQKKDWSFHKTICQPVPQPTSVPNTSFSAKDLIYKEEKFNGNTFPTYAPKQTTPSPTNFFIIADACALVMLQQIDCAEKLIEKKINQNPAIIGHPILLPNTTFINSINKDFLDLEQEAKVKKNDKVLPLLDKAKKILVGFFQNKPFIELSTLPDDRKNLIRKLRVECELYLFEQSKTGFNHTIKLFEPSFEDLSPFGGAELQGKIKPHKFSCTKFAFLKTGENKAKDWIFSDKEFQSTDFSTHFIEWKYGPVKIPQKGDLVLYFKDGVHVHTGVYQGATKVLSKNGTENPYVIEHDIFEVPHDYGREIVFFSKR